MSDSPTTDLVRPLLFQPFTIRGLTLKNRLVVPPMVHYRAEPGATCGMFHHVHLGRYALGGFGLVFVEATGVEETGLINEFDLGIWNEAQAESFKPLIAFMKAMSGLKLSACASFQMPRSCSLIRPTSSTAVASTKTSPKPPSA